MTSGVPGSTPAPPVLRSEGQRMLLAVTGSLAAIAAECGAKSPESIAEWKTGAKQPSASARARIQTAFGIPQRAWSVRPGGTLDPEPEKLAQTVGAVAGVSSAAPTTLDDCMALLAVIRRDRMQTGLMPSERVKLADAEARILGLRARLEDNERLAESRYVTGHPAWVKLKRAILRALERHPDAMQSVLDAITETER